MRANVGDRLVIEGDETRTGLIIGVPAGDGSPPYIVKWLASGHIAMVSPGDFARIIPTAGPAESPPGPSSARRSCRAGEKHADVVRHERL
jgi:hypothetical protein